MTFDENTFNPCNICNEYKCDVCILHMFAEEELKRGRWEERPVNVGTCTTGLFCSECNFPSLGWRSNYCSNCGIKMEVQ